jgi:hypothetical protein
MGVFSKFRMALAQKSIRPTNHSVIFPVTIRRVADIVAGKWRMQTFTKSRAEIGKWRQRRFFAAGLCQARQNFSALAQSLCQKFPARPPAK